MVKPFQFARTPQIYFGNGKISELPALIQKNGNSVLLVTGKGSFMNSLQGNTLLELFESIKILYKHVSISIEPSPSIIDETVMHSKHYQPDVVVAIGGGSVMDAGKAISAMIPLQSSVREYLEGIGTLVHPGEKVPFIAVPTTSGTGSEATKNAVISEIGESGFKRSLRHDNFVPDVALIDPELTISCPRDITAASGMDCFTQLTEAYLSGKSGEYTDALAIEGLKAVKTSLVRCYVDGGDVLARKGMSFAALTSGICLANAGLGVIHGFASSLGGTYDIPHGIICSTLMAKSNEINVRELRKRDGSKDALKKYAILGRLFLNAKGKKDDFYIDGFIQYLHDLTNSFHLPGLIGFGIEKENIEKICTETDLKNNPVELSLADLKEILAARFH
jgi:alcohol dehydrogenase class IV